MAEKIFTITRTIPTVYLDKAGKAVNGYQVTFDLYEFDETHDLDVPSLDPTTVQAAIDKFIIQRRALAKLGG